MLINKNTVYWFFNIILLLALLFLITLPSWGHPPPNDPGREWHHGSRYGHQPYHGHSGPQYRSPHERRGPYYDHHNYRERHHPPRCNWYWSYGAWYGNCNFNRW